jgi:ankyrin repeat protein
LNIVATEKYKAHGKFAGVPQPFAKMKYIEIVSHFADGGESSFIDAQNSHDDIVYEEDEAVDEDGCPLQGDDEFSGFGVRQSTLNNESAEIKGNETNDSRLRRAAIHSDEKLLKQAIDNGADVNGADESGQTALHFAADRGSIECIQLLIKHGASVNAADCDGISILFTAVMTGNLDVVKLLLENGANPDVEDKDGETPRAWVVDETDDMVKLFDAYPKIS